MAKQAVTLLENIKDPDLLARALINYGSIELELGRSFEKCKFEILRAVAIAVERKDSELESLAWEYLGESSLNAEKLGEADQALKRAHQLRSRLPNKSGLSLTLMNEADLDYRRHKFAQAWHDLNQALAFPRSDLSTLPQYEPMYLRGQILVALGRPDDGLSALSRAVRFAREWRRYSLPGDTTSTRTVVQVHKVFRDYAAVAAELALQRHDSLLARRALDVLSENRAASLREQLLSAFRYQRRLPPHYYELLSQLQQEQAHATLERNPANIMKVANIRLELSTIENEVGFRAENATSKRSEPASRDTIRRVQEQLGNETLLLSFSLGESKSYLWAVTANQLSLVQLPSAVEINKQAQEFIDSVRSGNQPVSDELSKTILGRLSPSIYEKPNWLIVADGALLSGVPFAALPFPKTSGKHVPLSLDHTLRFLPSERLLLSRSAAPSNQIFLGIGDPIYNGADPRCRLVNSGATANRRPILLARLLGSSRELRASALDSGLSHVEILTGERARSQCVAKLLPKQPEVIHFAVHVVSPADRPGEAALALSITEKGIPQLLTAETIATYRVPGSLVVLSGCSSERGQFLPSAGVIGLGRAWLLAGASAVIVSSWRVPDESGLFFSSFYRHLKEGRLVHRSVAERAAFALHQAQNDMRRGYTYQSLPSFWASYSVLSRE